MSGTPAGSLKRFVTRVRGRWSTALALRTAGLACVLAALPIAAAGLLARSFAFRGPVLIGVAAGAAAIVVSTFFLAWRRARRRPSDEATARFIEEQASALGLGRLNDRLVSAIQVVTSGGELTGPFGALVIQQAQEAMEHLRPEAVVTRRHLGWSAAIAATGVAAMAAAVVFAWPAVAGAAAAARFALFPGTIVVSVQPGDVRIVAGRALRIAASVSGGGQGELPGLDASLVVAAGGEQRTVPMARAGAGYQFEFESVDRSFAYKVVAGGVESRSYLVTALVPPRIQRIDLHYEYPPFSGLQPRVDEDGGDIYGPVGTRVRVRIHTDKDVTGGALALSRAAAIPLRAAAPRTAEATLTLTAESSYRVHVTGEEGLLARGDTEYFIRLLDDRPPEVRIMRPSADAPITPLQEVAIEARADDDHGISRFEIAYAVAGRPGRVAPFSTVTGTAVAKTGVFLLSAEELDVQPGDVVSYYARAVDVGRGKRPTEARSDMFFLEVKPFSEEFVAAQSQAAGAGAAGAQLEGLIAAQKEIINATWGLERRSAAGRSAEDAGAVAQAQAELKARVEQVRATPRRRFRGVFSVEQPRQPATGAAAPDPIAAAIEAMGQAHEALQAQRTNAALGHELAALRGLLQAQAEVRRREVQQSAAAGGQGGTSRVGQDLSALFDRELQRQQRTNYESRSQVEERPDAEHSTALDRIRELARRQEDLSRRQRELADAHLDEQERKRQLEKLTREQEALRAEAEALRKDMGTSVAQQMGAAARDLRRQDARAAAEKSAAAAEGLRRAEGQINSRSADARARTAGELQVEAQQIAEAQKRLAAEAARSAGERTPGAPPGRGEELAHEKEKLATRIEALERSARRLGETGGTSGDAGRRREDPAARAREAADVLQRENAASRMRESARELRQRRGDGAARAATAEREQQLARTLDRAAETLAGAGTTDRALAERLEQTRAMRDALNRLEARVREAEARERVGSTRDRSGSTGRETRAGRDGRSGLEGQQGSTGGGGAAELQRLREEYARELQRTRDALGRLEGEQRSGQMLATPEKEEFSRSAPGTEAFKQDHSGWDTLRRSVDLAMERYEASASKRLAPRERDRLQAGGSERVPEAYRESIARYYRSLAGKP